MSFSDNTEIVKKNSMRSLPPESGEAQQLTYSLPPELSSLSDGAERYFTDNWLLQAGVLSESSVQTLLLYAYGVKGVTKVMLELNSEAIAQGSAPILTYKVTMHPYYTFRWKKLQEAMAIKGEVWRKINTLFWAKMGAPIGIDSLIIDQATKFLPPQYTVKVEVL